jgi:CHASE3 domain sensor protein
MQPSIRELVATAGPGVSLRRRVAFSLAIVRLILAPVILLAVFYLFQMGRIIDRIVNVDAPSATLAQQASIQMLEARRSERDFFLLRDASDAERNHNALTSVASILAQIRRLQPDDQQTVRDSVDALAQYQQQFAKAEAYLSQPGESSNERIEAVVRNYEKDLNELVRRNRWRSKTVLIDRLRTQVGSFDTQISTTLQERDPNLRQVASELDASGRQVIGLTSTLEADNWQRVQQDHEDGRRLLHRAEWVLSVVSAFTIILSVWVSFILPRQVVKPLLTLKQAVDRASSGDYEIEVQREGTGEVAELARSVHNLIAHLTGNRQTA